MLVGAFSVITDLRMELFEALVLTVSVLAGWVGGSTGLICGHPLDTVKVVQQAGSRASMLQVASPTEYTVHSRKSRTKAVHFRLEKVRIVVDTLDNFR